MNARRTIQTLGNAWRERGLARTLLLVVLGLCAAAALATTVRQWMPIAKDGLRDPTSPAIGLLQEPREALSALPPDVVGNQVRWMEALDKGLIQPRTNIQPETIVNIRNTDVLLKNTGEVPMVRFPHRQHTAWLDCTNCHNELFSTTAGATRINMMLILSGEKCGVCHGAVAFPLTECNRCHSVVRGSPAHLEFGNSLVKEATPR